MKAADRPTLAIDKDFKIEIDALQWIVLQRHIRKEEGTEYWTQEGYCRDLPACLKKIILIKTLAKQDLTSVNTYLDWYASVMHSMLDRVQRQEKRLKEAIEVNQVMHSYHNVN